MKQIEAIRFSEIHIVRHTQLNSMASLREKRPFCPSSTAHGTSRILSKFVNNIKTHDQKYNMTNGAVLEEYDNSRSWTTKTHPESQRYSCGQ